MHIRRASGWPFAVAAALAPSWAGQAQAPAPDIERPGWMLGLGAQADEDDGDGLLATLFAGVGERTWLTFAAGTSSSPAEGDDVESDTLLFGVDHRFDEVGFTLDIEQWGDSGALETQELGASVYVARPRWRIDFRYETRDTEIPLTLRGPLGGTLQRELDVPGDGLAVSGHVELAERWRLYFGAAEYDYDHERTLNALLFIDNLNWLDPSTLTLASGLLDYERWVAVEHSFGNTLLDVRFVSDRSALDDSKLETLDVAVLFPVGRRFDLQVNVGHGRSEFFDAGLYAGLLFLLYGG
jgi:hypothetical protein